MPVELTEVEYLHTYTSFRPYLINSAFTRTDREALRSRFMTWMDERHGIVVYLNQIMDSSRLGDMTFMPRMVNTVEAGMQPAPRLTGMELASTQQIAIDWIQSQPTKEENRQLLDRCFYFERRKKRVRLFSETPATKKWPDPESLLKMDFGVPIRGGDGARIGLTSVDVTPWYEDPEGVWVSRIYTPPQFRNKGYCRSGMERLLSAADWLQVRIYIAPNSYEDHVTYMNNQQLMAWWRRLGFQRAFGRGRLMVRYPK